MLPILRKILLVEKPLFSLMNFDVLVINNNYMKIKRHSKLQHIRVPFYGLINVRLLMTLFLEKFPKLEETHKSAIYNRFVGVQGNVPVLKYIKPNHHHQRDAPTRFKHKLLSLAIIISQNHLHAL